MINSDYIGQEVQSVVKNLNLLGYQVKQIDNNYNVNGDILLVTNIKIQGKVAKVYTGEFIFAVEDNKNV